MESTYLATLGESFHALSAAAILHDELVVFQHEVLYVALFFVAFIDVPTVWLQTLYERL